MPKKYTVVKRHEIHAAHRVHGHQGKCQYLHGHTYVFRIHCQSTILDELGMVVDFSVIKNTLCNWLDDNYDHKTLIWQNDPIAKQLAALDKNVTLLSYNPTAENIANHILTSVAPKFFANTNIVVTKIVLEESSNSQAICEL